MLLYTSEKGLGTVTTQTQEWTHMDAAQEWLVATSAPGDYT